VRGVEPCAKTNLACDSLQEHGTEVQTFCKTLRCAVVRLQMCENKGTLEVRSRDGGSKLEDGADGAGITKIVLRKKIKCGGESMGFAENLG
jgi:hypothetical protein